MKKYLTRAGLTALLAASLLIVVMAAATVCTYAYSYDTDIDEGVQTTVNWPSDAAYDAVTYVKIKPSRKGYITFTADFSCYVSLCNSSKKVISRGSYSSGDYLNGTATYKYMRKIAYGVKKGATYYIKIKNRPSKYNEEGKYVGVMKYTTKKISPSKYGRTKKRARTLRRKRTSKGLFVAGNRKPQWFKFTTRQKRANIYINAKNNNDTIKFKVYYKSYGRWYNKTFRLLRSDDYYKDVIKCTVNKKVKHTYFIKVYPGDKSSGYYTIKWR